MGKKLEDLTKRFKVRFDFDWDLISKNIRILTDKTIAVNYISEFEKYSSFSCYPVISDTPKYCLVALEPNLNKTQIEGGGLIDFHFTGSLRTLLLQYHVFKLCDYKFEYHITDICKTPMSSGLANLIRSKLYAYKAEGIPSWYVLFKEEIDILQKPEIIPIGITVRNYLEIALNTKIEKHIFHYGSQLTPNFIAEYERLGMDINTVNKDKFREELKEFSNELFKKIRLNPKAADNKLKLVDKKFSDFFIKKHLVYVEQFSKFFD